jgi:hypothetical protein
VLGLVGGGSVSFAEDLRIEADFHRELALGNFGRFDADTLACLLGQKQALARFELRSSWDGFFPVGMSMVIGVVVVIVPVRFLAAAT